MERVPHETVATVLVEPGLLPVLEVHLMGLDLRLWPVATAPTCVDGPRRAFQLRRQLLTARRGAWDDAADWVPSWISFGDSWREGDEPISWPARRLLYGVLDGYAPQVRYARGLTGVPPLAVPHERTA